MKTAAFAAALICLGAGVSIAGDEAVVLMYHRFGDDRYPSTNIRVEQLEAQLEYLADNGFTVVPLSDVLAAIRGDGELPDRAVALTVDDAYRSVYTVGYPRFRERGMPFTVFVATDPVDGGQADFMTWDQMREMAEHGVTFANHGATHDSVIDRRGDESRSAWLARVRADVSKGARRLTEELTPLSGVFAYPYGEYDEGAAAVIADLGLIAFGQHSGAVGPTGDPRALPRFPMAEAFADMGEFAVKVSSRPLPVAGVSPWDPVTPSKRPRIEVTLADTDARLDRFACFVSGQGEVAVEWLEPRRRFAVAPKNDLPLGRNRVNCTAPAAEGGRFHWFSHPWVVRSTQE
ncbi:MAG: polysaccharide deacetylase family protein [Candidatus Sulfomarinibacteraceae bacterium]